MPFDQGPVHHVPSRNARPTRPLRYGTLLVPLLSHLSIKKIFHYRSTGKGVYRCESTMSDSLIDLWGPGAWAFLHSCSFRYPESGASADERNSFYDFLWALARVMPCPLCRTHFIESLEEHVPSSCAPTLDTRDQLARYIVELHNDVNRRSGKPQWTFEQARKYYTRTGTCPISEATPSPTQKEEKSPHEEESPRRRTSPLLELNALAIGLLLALLVLLAFSARTNSRALAPSRRDG